MFCSYSVLLLENKDEEGQIQVLSAAIEVVLASWKITQDVSFTVSAFLYALFNLRLNSSWFWHQSLNLRLLLTYMSPIYTHKFASCVLYVFLTATLMISKALLCPVLMSFSIIVHSDGRCPGSRCWSAISGPCCSWNSGISRHHHCLLDCLSWIQLTILYPNWFLLLILRCNPCFRRVAWIIGIGMHVNIGLTC